MIGIGRNTVEGRPCGERMDEMRTRKATLLLTALLYAQGLLGVAAVAAVLLKTPGEGPKNSPVAAAAIADVG